MSDVFKFKKFSSVAILFAILVKFLCGLFEEDLYAVNNCLHSTASTPDGPWLPFIMEASLFSEPFHFETKLER